MENYYNLLGVNEYSSDKEILKALNKYSKEKKDNKFVNKIFTALLSNRENRFQYNEKLFNSDDNKTKNREIKFIKNLTNDKEFQYFELDTEEYDKNFESLKEVATSSGYFYKYLMLFVSPLFVWYTYIYIKYEIIGWGELHRIIESNSSETAASQLFPMMLYYSLIIILGVFFVFFLIAIISILYTLITNPQTFFSKQQKDIGKFIAFAYEKIEDYDPAVRRWKIKENATIFYKFNGKIFSNKLPYKLCLKLLKNNVNKIDIFVKDIESSINRKSIKQLN